MPLQGNGPWLPSEVQKKKIIKSLVKGKQHLLRSRKQTFSLTAQSPSEVVYTWVQAGQNVLTSPKALYKEVLIVKLLVLPITLKKKQ